MVLPFFFPHYVDSAIAGPEETKHQRGEVLRLIQIPFRHRQVLKNLDG